MLALFVFMRKFVCLCLLGIKINYPGYFFLRFFVLASFLSRYFKIPACFSVFRALTLASPEVRFHIDSETHDPVDLQTKELK